MRGVGVYLFFLVPLGVGVAVVLGVGLLILRLTRRGVRWSQIPDPVAQRWRTLSATAWWVGAALAVVAVALIAGADDLGRGLLLTPLVFGLVLVAATGVGELITARSPGPRPTGDREVTLEVRTVTGLVPLGRRVVAVLGMVAVLLVTVLAALVSVSDDLGRAGRALPYSSADGAAEGWRGPWPGWFYTIPIWILLAALLVTVAWVLRLVVDRPRSGPGARERYLDDLIRRTTAQRVVALVALVSFGTAWLTAVMGLTGLTGAGDSEFYPGTTVSLYAVGWVCLAALLVLGAASVLALVQLLAPVLPTQPAPSPQEQGAQPS
ncbi:hypothetical protein [Ornithinimicrobium pratense]|uniref:Uncharacterized protein n=1 Tax=Ornithinimicrobium pratense TaxID=2593973 RepID=A0A5J6V5I1_9MICO|nr:hypothetical protein [Ornithinimicrobium pratense]QFG68273.1 hypothetical protein FY030_05670 [Ornithinimicrobium pratense]